MFFLELHFWLPIIFGYSLVGFFYLCARMSRLYRDRVLAPKLEEMKQSAIFTTQKRRVDALQKRIDNNKGYRRYISMAKHTFILVTIGTVLRLLFDLWLFGYI